AKGVVAGLVPAAGRSEGAQRRFALYEAATQTTTPQNQTATNADA
ncbi:hypothetical protein LCGC14_2868210, partial [marine sediment metagenome]